MFRRATAFLIVAAITWATFAHAVQVRMRVPQNLARPPVAPLHPARFQSDLSNRLGMLTSLPSVRSIGLLKQQALTAPASETSAAIAAETARIAVLFYAARDWDTLGSDADLRKRLSDHVSPENLGKFKDEAARFRKENDASSSPQRELGELSEAISGTDGPSLAEVADRLDAFFAGARVTGSGDFQVEVRHAAGAQAFRAPDAKTAEHRLRRAMTAIQRQSSQDAARRDELERSFADDTQATVSAFRTLVMDPGSVEALELARLFPEIAGMLRLPREDFSYDLEWSAAGFGRDETLFRHVIDRTLGRKLLGLEQVDRSAYQDGDAGLSQRAFEEDAERLERVNASGFLSRLRMALLYHDAAKGDPATFREQLSHNSIDLAIPNTATAELLKRKRFPELEREGLFENMGALDGEHREVLDALAYQLIALRGYPGQHIRGEVMLEVFEPYTEWLRRNKDALAAAPCLPTSSTCSMRSTRPLSAKASTTTRCGRGSRRSSQISSRRCSPAGSPATPPSGAPCRKSTCGAGARKPIGAAASASLFLRSHSV